MKTNPKYTKFFISLFLFVTVLTVLEIECYAQRTRQPIPPKFFVRYSNGKYGAVDKNNRVVIPFIYHDCRVINNDLFAVQNNDKLCSEYVIDSTQKVLTEPVFCEIDSFKRGKVFQSWNKTILAYTPDGVCLNTTEKQEKKGLFKMYLKNIENNEIYKRNTSIPIGTKVCELIFVSPNQYQYVAQEGSFVFIQRSRAITNLMDSVYLSLEEKRTPRHLSLRPFCVEVTKIMMRDTKTKEEKYVIGQWNCCFNWDAQIIELE